MPEWWGVSGGRRDAADHHDVARESTLTLSDHLEGARQAVPKATCPPRPHGTVCCQYRATRQQRVRLTVGLGSLRTGAWPERVRDSSGGLQNQTIPCCGSE